MIIAFSGVDCAGKSTHIRLLQEYLISKGKSCTVLWYRPGYSKEMQKCKDVVRRVHGLYRLCRRLPERWFKPHAESEAVVNGGESSAGEVDVKRLEALADEPLRLPPPLWLITAFIDTVFQWGVKLRALEARYDVVICDRYFEDARLDIAFKYPEYMMSEALFAPLKKAMPKPDVALLLWLPYEVVCQRALSKNEPFPDSPTARAMRYRAYEFLADDGEFSVIDATGSVEETHRQILDLLETKALC